ncbi:proteinase inhibitor I4 serpin [Kribbella turkmenica]|uniref:Proteinase inhibitor I4 serpin n=1 Tax=Kribbella turkmenica TaxID=2530375 RepID=A0A4R4WRA7_9ACTN|nr:serpin family protein [Kribbella turkmenica]TDD17810.1 proteinase inhibitor I4 serpin [Kribbella turkmenica]
MDADVVRAVNDLTARWARNLPEGNTVVSGLGLWPLLAILATAADEPGRAELAAAAGVGASAGSRQALELIQAIEGSDDLHAALGVWVQERLKLAESFDSVMPAPLVGTLTGDASVDKPKLDAWAAGHTDDLIREMPIEVTPDLMLVLASALSLRTTWVTPFKEQVRRFYDGPWSGGSWHWLERVDGDLDAVRRYEHPGTAGLTVVTVPGDADVDVLLGIGQPQESQDEVLPALIETAVRSTDGVPGSQLLGQGEPGAEVAPGVKVGQTTVPRPDLKLSLPSFTVEAEHDLMAARELFGLSTVSTDPGAHGHFGAISPTPLAVGQAKQKVLARFFATGFEAAAVTAMGLMRTSMPTRQARRLEVTLDRPFGFVAVLRESRLPIVAGWVATPTEPGD